MSNQEYYIRKAHEPDARGPFTLEQLSSLAENAQADADTFYYDATTEAWTPISANPTLMETLFPAKKNLRVKAKNFSQVKNLNTVSETDRAITVGDMLLASEGRTEDTRDKANPAEAQARAAGIGLYAALAILLITAAAFILPGIDRLFALDWVALLQQPLPFFGLLNLALGICVGLGAVDAYPGVRFSAMLGFGFAGTVFFLQGEPLPLAFSAASAVGLYFCTIVLNLPAVFLAASCGIIGACGLAQHLFTS